MKRLFLLFSLFAFTLSARAQFPGGGSSVTGRISGSVIDSVTKKPIDYATITLYRSGGKVPLNGVVTDEKGGFRINNINNGKYKITVSFIGYPTKTIDPVTTTPGKPDANLGAIRLSPSGRTLKGVDIVADAPLIDNRIDKIVYNAEKDVTSAGGNATDILRKVPLLSVDINGNVALRGDQNVRVLINGKPSGAMSNNLADVLRSLPADQIKNVEVITSPSAKYDAEGSGGIINIITKNKNVAGVSGSVSGGVGTRQNNGNINLNIKQNRLTVTANIGGNYTWPQTTPSTFYSYNDTSRTLTNQTTLSKVKRYAGTGSGSVNYDFNNFNSITSTIRFNQGGFKTNSDINNVTTDPKYNSAYYNNTNSKSTFGGFDWNAAYTHKFKKEGHELSVAGQWSHSISEVDYTSLYTPVGSSTNTFQNQQANNDGKNNEYTLQADYSLPVNKVLKIEAGGKSIFRRINSNSDFYNQLNGGEFTYNPTTSNDYDYNQDVYAGYSVFSFTLPKSIGLQVGARVENTQIEGKSANTVLGLVPFDNSYTTFIPSFAISKTFNSTQTFKLSYTKRIQRPSLQFLNPFLNTSNVQNQSVGNPYLSPEVSQTVEFNFNTFIKSSVINASVYYKHTNNIIESLVGPVTYTTTSANGTDITRNVNRTTYANVGENNSLGVSFFGSVNPIKPLTLRGSINSYTYDPNASGAFQAQQSSTGTYILYNVFANGTLALKGGFTAEVFAILNSPRRTIQGTNPSFGFVGLGARKEILKKKATIGFNTLSPYKKAIDFDQNITGNHLVQTTKTAFPFRSFGLTFSYNFGKINYNVQPKKGINNDDLKQGDTGGSGIPSGSGTGSGSRQ
ncbi:TonB-dependent receptor domain-containing protein [Mucilaginibacter arboris]|uniref:TonB-dependent receptor n=1 Tax=Mucilaginibacter arboris TaxID=2682090 RepID=A0A7K1SW71_9SPHI|nr:TonB-dependent receptor [Mucilaginibacter arboris]MVN21566.1 TonB-dependent receptor [Mucilaginibacter arboris]